MKKKFFLDYFIIRSNSAVWQFKLKVLVLFLLIPLFALSQSPLQHCKDQFIGSSIENAPTLFRSSSDKPFATNCHLCYRDEEDSFFALEYWPEQYAPRWVAYKLDPGNYGDDGCNTFTRNTARCYFNSATWEEFLECRDANDPFHADYMIEDDKLGSNPFSNTGHDRGHMATGQFFNWNVCGWYQTFSMANMSPQKAFLNQQIWAHLENQVLTWAYDSGPIYVVTGTVFSRFPHHRFDVYKEGVLNAQQIYPANNRFEDIVKQHRNNFENNSTGEILRPLRNANPDNMLNKVRDMRVPTGYFKVIFLPGKEGQSDRTIGFLVPHSFEHLNFLADSYQGLDRNKAFWAFASTITLIEEVSGVRFPGIPVEQKGWGDQWFFDNKTSRTVRPQNCGQGTPKGVIENSTRHERIDACKSFLIVSEAQWSDLMTPPLAEVNDHCIELGGTAENYATKPLKP